MVDVENGGIDDDLEVDQAGFGNGKNVPVVLDEEFFGLAAGEETVGDLVTLAI